MANLFETNEGRIATAANSFLLSTHQKKVRTSCSVVARSHRLGLSAGSPHTQIILKGRRFLYCCKELRALVTELQWPSIQPELTDGVVTLRPWRSGDAPWVCEVCQDPDVQQWTRVPTPPIS